ncbi:hypothetical protein LTR56_024088 [Elasticomyces elasticus]|nr:hypothetical protein LTR56_024088 [Elasticomyces elasticus]KAK3662806.1 hypothetical protein LTR22_006422 [Elasticomyces elasticus]KAK4911896.1 hypothetical protein LTR49_019613 [Elasticomyces elasticus]KAK5746306.1 hypothetical protein LTS12_022786 [Elasticomyces elasticus]
MSTESRDAKRALRKDIKDRLSALSEAEITTQSQTAQQLILDSTQYAQASKVGIYLSMPNGEAQTDLLVRNALKAKKQVFVPYLCSAAGSTSGKGKVMAMLHLSSTAEYEDLKPDAWGIPTLTASGIESRENAMGGFGTPTSGCDDDAFGHISGDETGLDLIVVPGVAFEEDMSRLGHGAGFYDRFLTRYCEGGKRKKPFLVGLCLAEQVLPKGKIIMQDWDWRVDAVAVGDGRTLRATV